MKQSDALNIGGMMRGHFGKAIIWTVPRGELLNLRLRIEPKFAVHHEVLVFDTNKGYDPGDGGRYHGELIAHGQIPASENAAVVVTLRQDPRTREADIVVDGNSILSGTFRTDSRRPILLVLSVVARDAGAKVNTSFTSTEASTNR